MTLRSYKNIFPKLFDNSVFVDESAVVIGEVELAKDVGIWTNSVLRGDVNFIKIGNRSNIQDGSVLHVTRKGLESSDGSPLIIGEEVTVGHNVILHGCTLKNRILVGMGTIILDDAIIEDEVLIGAGSLVPQGKKLESGFLYLGSPVKQIRLLKAEEKEFLKISAQNYVDLKNSYLEEIKQSELKKFLHK